MNVLTVRINAWQEARSLADGLPGWIFRGQQDASWGLSTALERAGQQSQGTSFLLSKIEEQIIEEFQRRAHHFLPDPPKLTDLIEWRSVIQHFGGPTRLPDFTGSFYVAAFFAAEKATKDCAIWYVNHNALYKSVGRALGINIEDLMIPYYRVSHQMVGLAQRFIGERQAPYHQFVFEVQPFRLNERAAVQQGVFCAHYRSICPL